ncbi:MAG: hypothetical protein ABIQ52_14665, partial [Vicinamibacterales bacterium]
MKLQKRLPGSTAACAAIVASLLSGPAAAQGDMAKIARDYVRMVLAMGQHDKDYVDAYYGPDDLKKEAEGAQSTLEGITAGVASLQTQVAAVPSGGSELERLRHQYLEKQLAAMAARVRILKGERMLFDEESKALYDAVSPSYPDSHYQAVLDKLEKRFPGSGSLVERYDAWRRAFVIPREKLDTVFQAAIGACRQRTLAHVTLPANEHFTVEYVTNKSWSGYNWYQGNFRSLIQVNTDLPIYIDRAIDLACHEGYPGHHVYNALLEQHLVKERGWIEFTVYPLFSPQSLIAEGTANFGIEVAFPGRERVAYEQSTLFPLAGLDGARAGEYYEVMALVDQLSYAGNDAARRYLDGKADAAATTAWLERYALMPRDRAAQRVRFFDQYRSYVINYNHGKDLVRTFIEKRGGTPANPVR